MTFQDTLGVFFLKKKYEVLERFIEFKALVENASGRKIKSLRYDNGGEYTKFDLLQICAKHGSQIQHSIPYTPQQNGVTERKNRALKKMTTYMLEAKGLAANIWDEEMNVSYYIHNRVPHSSMKVKIISNHTLGTNQRCPISEFLGPLLGLEFH